MPYFTYMWNLKNKINEQVEEKHTHRYREHFEVARWEGYWVKKVEGLRSTNW